MWADENGSVRVQLDGESSERVLARAKLLKAPAPTNMQEGQYTRVAFSHEDLPKDALRWQYGRLIKVYPCGELVSIVLIMGKQRKGYLPSM